MALVVDLLLAPEATPFLSDEDREILRELDLGVRLIKKVLETAVAEKQAKPEEEPAVLRRMGLLTPEKTPYFTQEERVLIAGKKIDPDVLAQMLGQIKTAKEENHEEDGWEPLSIADIKVTRGKKGKKDKVEVKGIIEAKGDEFRSLADQCRDIVGIKLQLHSESPVSERRIPPVLPRRIATKLLL